MLDQIDTTTRLVIAVCTAAALLGAAYRVLWHGGRDKDTRRRKPGLIKAVLLDLRGFRDAIIGRPAVLDSITRVEQSPALPGIGQRMASQEQWMQVQQEQMTKLTEAVAKIADSHHRIDDLDERVTALEQQTAERFVGKVEQVQMLRTMEAVAKGDPELYDEDPLT